MPSVKVPLKGEPGWNELVKNRQAYWRADDHHKLTRNFTAYEFYTHDGTPCPIKARPAMIALCKDFLEPLRAKFGTCYVLSGYRHERYNQAIGGARHSQHIYEQSFESVAADVRFARGTPTQWANEAKKLRTSKRGGKGGIGLYVRSGFIHVDNRNYKADWTG